MQCSDWNAVRFGNDCIVDGFLKLLTFEDMMLKVKQTHIQDGCTVAFGAMVMGGAVIERDTALLPLSLVLKEMNMITATYEGNMEEALTPRQRKTYADYQCRPNEIVQRMRKTHTMTNCHAN
jgi:carbonic anhydrase/acetyltransferase-like protein (isoleucine patch superfamily)